ncbi:DinB family protein [Trinickia acidisoli]|uniref:DinB family protein n=1 Tax=Trinickia acidisoli TaxID=2767482 RepID=UPI001F5D153A|nr:DinB family protein [Trinickia acidisoli]
MRFLKQGSSQITSRSEILAYVVNHTSFHRGFIADILRRMSVSVPATDLATYIRDRK